MVTIRFSTVPGVLVEEAETSLALCFQLDQAPPVGELTATVKGNVSQSLVGYTVDPVNSAIAQSADRRPAPVKGTNQADRMVGTIQEDLLQGLSGNDALFGNAGSDALFGGAGNDQLFGGAGNDQLFGDTGSDTLRGGGGDDVFIARKGVGVDTIVDFRNNRDVIGIAPNISFGQLDIVQQGRDTLIRLGRDKLAVLQNVRADQITAADFIFT